MAEDNMGVESRPDTGKKAAIHEPKSQAPWAGDKQYIRVPPEDLNLSRFAHWKRRRRPLNVSDPAATSQSKDGVEKRKSSGTAVERIIIETDVVEAVRDGRACFVAPLDSPHKANSGVILEISNHFKDALIQLGEAGGQAEHRARKVMDLGFQGIMENNPGLVSRAITEPLLVINAARQSKGPLNQ